MAEHELNRNVPEEPLLVVEAEEDANASDAHAPTYDHQKAPKMGWNPRIQIWLKLALLRCKPEMQTCSSPQTNFPKTEGD